jgi:hypothetical protein
MARITSPLRLSLRVLAALCLMLIATPADPCVSFDTFAYYVSPTGSDSNAGTLAAPFATLGKAQTAMRAGSIKTTYLRGGTYSLSPVVPSGQFPAGLTRTYLYLTSADNGETWQFFPPDGVNTAVLDGGSSAICQTSSAVDYGFWIEGGSNITIDGLLFDHFTFAGINVHGGSSFYGNWETIVNQGTADSDVIENNLFENIWNGNPISACGGANPWPPVVSQDNAFGGGVGVLGAVTNLTITHNAILTTQGPGIDTQVFSSSDTVANLTVSYNFIYNANVSDHDNGCVHIYAATFPSATSGVTYKNNYVRDCGGTYGGGLDARSIYVDDAASGIVVSGNVVAGHTSVCFNYHGGNTNNVTGNICDMGDGALGNQRIALYQGDSFCNSNSCMTNNFLQNNIVIANASIALGGYFLNSPTTNLATQNNLEFSYSGTALTTDSTGTGSTSNPSLTCWTYLLASNSPAYSSPVSFPTQPANWGQAGFWGPPGYVIPQTGTAPSNPHSGC